MHINDTLAVQAQADAATAYAGLAGKTQTANLSGTDLGGLTLLPGVYHFDSTAALTGTLRLDTRNDPNGVFIFQIGSSLGVAAGSAVTLLGPNGSDPNIFWQVGSTAALAANANFAGNILALASVTLAAGANLVVGRAIAINASVTLSSNVVNGTGAPITGVFWNGGANNLWSGVNWSPDTTGATSATLVSGADVVFSVTGIQQQNQNTVLDVDETISSLTVDDPAGVTISGPHTLSIDGIGLGRGITINSGAGPTTINSDLQLSGFSQGITVNSTAGLVINGIVGGTVGLTKVGTGQLTLTAAESFTGETLIIGGTLQLGDGLIPGTSIASSAPVTVDGGAALALNLKSGEVFGNAVADNGLVTNIASGTNTLSGVISGAGVFIQNGTGLSILTGANTYTGGTTVLQGTLQIGDGGTSGSIVGDVTDNGHLAFNRSDAVLFTGSVSGSGSLSQIGSRTLTLSGNNSYSGTTTINAGTLQAGSTTGFSPNSAFTVNSVLYLNGFNNSITSLSGNTTGSVTNKGAKPGHFDGRQR
jgi:autotransporter-associated beta strand protein